MKRITPDEWRKISSNNYKNYTIDKKEELTKWNFNFRENTIKLWDVPQVIMKWSKPKNLNYGKRVLSPQPKKRIFLFIDSEALNYQTLFGKKIWKDFKTQTIVDQNIAKEEESIVSQKWINYEWMKRLISLYSHKRPAFSQHKNKKFDCWTKDSINISFYLKKDIKYIPTSRPKTKISLGFYSSPNKYNKFWIEEHEKRKQILSNLISENEIELIKENIWHDYRKE